MQLEAFMGSSYLGAEVIPHMSAGQGSAVARAKYMAAMFSPKDFSFDTSAGMSDPHVAEYKQLAEADKAAGTYQQSMEKLRSFVVATRNALKERLSKQMTDRETQQVVDIVGRLNLVLNITQDVFGGRIPKDTATMVEEYMGEINDITNQLMERRKAQYVRAKEQEAKALQFEQDFRAKVAAFNAAKDAGTTPSDSETADNNTGVPGGGPGEGDVPSPQQPGAAVDVEKTPMQKYGPVAALAAGGLVAFLALR